MQIDICGQLVGGAWFGWDQEELRILKYEFGLKGNFLARLLI